MPAEAAKAKGEGSDGLIDMNNLFFRYKKLIEERCEDELKKAALILVRRESGSIVKVLSAKRGNSSYANLTRKRMDSAARRMMEKMDEKGGSILMMTLTAKYDPTDIEGIFNSWERMKKKIWPPFSRWLRRNGFDSYICTFEANELGGCHINLVIYYKNELEAVIDKNRKSRLADKKFEREIKEVWWRFGGGRADIKIADPLGATAYVSKELGRESHIEAALKRSKRDWTGKGDEGKKSSDIKKLWGWYIACELNLRRYNMSRDLKNEGALVKSIIGNSTERKNYDKKDPIIDWFIIPRADLKKGIFTKKPGAVDKSSPEYWRASGL